LEPVEKRFMSFSMAFKPMVIRISIRKRKTERNMCMNKYIFHRDLDKTEPGTKQKETCA